MFGRRRRRLDEEVASHLASETADNVARGMDPVSAREAALRTFGNVEAAKERTRELNPLYWLDTICQDIRFSFRLIARNRWSSATVLATLTVGIALNVSAFTLINALLLRPWVRTAPDTFLSIVPRFSGQYSLHFSDGGMSQPDYLFYRDSAKSLESLAAYRLRSLTLGGVDSGSIRGGLISCNLFDVIAPGPPMLGRYLAAEDCTEPGRGAVAVLSETGWRRRFDADPQVIGQVIHLNRVPFTVVGVAPAMTLLGAGAGPPNDRDVWVPYSMLRTLRPADEYFSDPLGQWLAVVGRRHPAYTLQQVQEELSILARAADERVPGRVTSLVVTNGSLVQDPEMGSRAALLLGVSLGTAALLLVLACVNVTTLLLSRAAARQREIAVRLSLGAGRSRLLRQLLTESLVLSGIAAAASLVIARRAPAALWYSLTGSDAPFDLTPDWRVILYVAGIGLGAGIMAGLSPALESLRPGTSESLKGSSSAVTSRRPRSGLRAFLVAAQIALSLLMLVQAGLFAQAQRRFFTYDPGFETRQVLSLSLASVLAGYEPPASFYQELESRVNALPGVLRSSYASLAPWSGRNSTQIAEIDGRPIPETRDYRRDPARRMVSAEFFGVMGIPLTRGRAFGREAEAAKGEPVPAVISEAMARRYWPGQDPVGHQFRIPRLHEVIGVSRDVQSVAYMQDDGPIFYSPLDAPHARPPAMLVSVSGDARAATASLYGLVRQLDPQMAATIVTLASIIEGHGERLKPVMIYGVVAGVLALLLALTGVYGVVSFSVSQRSHELGLRVALGASSRDVVLLILRAGVIPIVGGLIAGVGLNVAVSSGLKAMYFGLNPLDPSTLVVAGLLLMLCALAAIWIPARRAAAVDPLSALRAE